MIESAFSVAVPITKVGTDDERLVFGWASVSTEGGRLVTDVQGDQIEPSELEKAAYRYVLKSRQAGEMHVRKTGIGDLVESIVFTKAKQDALGIDLGREGWWVGFKIHDDEVWKAIKKGEYSAFSIGGRGTRVPVKED